MASKLNLLCLIECGICYAGDDPRDVKARLKVWAQAVAIASASRHGGV